jgi:hypothetical protein
MKQEQIDNNMANFMSRIQNSKKIIQMDTNGTLDKIKNGSLSEGKMSYDENGVKVRQPSEYELAQMRMNQPVPNTPTASRLPKEILESFNAKQIGNDYNSLDFLTKAMPKEEKKTVVAEQTQPQFQQPSTSIDYSMIKMIVEESIRKYASALKKTILTESKNSQQESLDELRAMKIGDSFTFVTNKGDLYEAKLTYKGNVNKKGGK